MRAPPIVLLHGKNGSGKSTVAEKVVILGAQQGIKVAHIPLGEILRGIATGAIASRHAQSVQGQRDILTSHSQGSTQNAMGVFKEQIEAHMHADLIIANGVPRYQNRLPEFRKTIDALGADIMGVCHIIVSDEIARERSKQRARSDDDFEKRLAGYYEETAPTVEMLAHDYPYQEIDGEADATENARLILRMYADFTVNSQP